MKNKICELRKDKKAYTRGFSKKCSVTRQTINAIENDRYDPTLKLAFELSKVLETTGDDIFKG